MRERRHGNIGSGHDDINHQPRHATGQRLTLRPMSWRRAAFLSRPGADSPACIRRDQSRRDLGNDSALRASRIPCEPLPASRRHGPRKSRSRFDPLPKGCQPECLPAPDCPENKRRSGPAPTRARKKAQELPLKTSLGRDGSKSQSIQSVWTVCSNCGAILRTVVRLGVITPACPRRPIFIRRALGTTRRVVPAAVGSAARQ
jgi:hypothetical protein